MPIIYTYPSATPTNNDLLLISDVSETDPENATRKCTVGDIVSLVGSLVPGGGTVTSVGLQAGTTGLTIATTTTNPITTTGTFTIGGTLVAANGGTGHNSYTVGDLIYASGATALSKLTAGTLNHVLTSGGPGVAPSWSAPTTGTVTSVNVSGGTTGLTYSGGPITSSGTITMAGTLIVANGGTGATSLTDNYVLLGSGTSAITPLDVTAKGSVLVGRGAGLDPIALAVSGNNGYVLKENSTTASGLAWEAEATASVNWTLAGSAGTPQAVASGETATVAGTGGGITTTAVATRTVRVSLTYSPYLTNYDSSLTLIGSTSGATTATLSTNLAQYWTAGDYIYLEFYMIISNKAGLSGDIIIDNLPFDCHRTGVAFPQGSCTITANDNMSSGGNFFPIHGKVGETALDQVSLQTQTDYSAIAKPNWTHVTTVEGTCALGGTIEYLRSLAS